MTRDDQTGPSLTRNKQRTGFTIVELLIVIVVVAVLATISVVAYNGVQQRSRDNARTAAINQIRKALEAYKVEHGRYPSYIAAGTNVPEGFTGTWGTSYSYSVATDDSWLRNLVQATPKIVSSVPVDPTNDNSHYFVYWSSSVNGYGACTEPFYMLGVVGYENPANVPKDSKGLNCTNPDGSSPANWTTNSTRAVFSNYPR